MIDEDEGRSVSPAARSSSSRAKEGPGIRALLGPVFWRLVTAAALINLVAAQILHEAGHWLVLTVTGRNPVWGLTAVVQLADRAPVDASGWVASTGSDGAVTWLRMETLPGSDLEWFVFLVAGPLAQLLGVGVGLWLGVRAVRPTIRSVGLLIALVNGVGHALYQLISALQGGGADETLLAEYSGVPWWVFSGVFGLVAAMGAVAAVRRITGWQVRLRWVGATLLGAVATGPIFRFVQEAIIDGVDRGGALFTPALGFSLPVLILGAAGVSGLWLVTRRWPVAGP